MNKLILLLRKGAYSYEFMNDWETFNKTSLPERKKKEFYFNLNMVILQNQSTIMQKKFIR